MITIIDTPKRYFQRGNRSYEQQSNGKLKRIPNILKHGLPGHKPMPSRTSSIQELIDQGLLPTPNVDK